MCHQSRRNHRAGSCKADYVNGALRETRNRSCLLNTDDLEALLGDAVDKVLSINDNGLDSDGGSRQTAERSEDLRVGLPRESPSQRQAEI